MPLICYERKNFSEERLSLIVKANLIIEDYRKKGFSLTLRQLYYVFVSNDLFPDSWTYRNAGAKWVYDERGTKNAPPNYNSLGGIINDGRMAGLIDWNAIVDRTRASMANQHWARPSQILEATVNTYAIDKWAEQRNYVEVWVEKEALEDVLAQACSPLDVRFFACKGYTSQSAMWEAAQRLVSKIENGKEVHIIHLGDHDPSGIDMSRDILDRLTTFTDNRPVNFHRIALNMNQVEEYAPPPNPAKVTDSRFKSYSELYGDESWELDALEPTLMVDLIRREVMKYRDPVTWESSLVNEQRGRKTLQSIIQYFPDVVKFLRERRQVDSSNVICSGCGATVNNPTCLCDVDKAGKEIG